MPYGKPYLYQVWHIVQVGGVIVDAVQSPLGIRTISWNENLPIINGHPMSLQGASGRYDYPALGTAVPAEQQWRDLQLLAEAGGNLWRPGHSSSSPEFVAAADALGIMIVQPSGEGEGAFSAQGLATPTSYPAVAPADQEQLKREMHRDMILRDRNHPSILAWEADNGPMILPLAHDLEGLIQQWDPATPRAQVDRTPNPDAGLVLGCTLNGCELGVKSAFPDNPAWGAEYWGRASARDAYDYQIAYVAEFVDNWRRSRNANAWGIAQWYLAETPGESANYLEGVMGPGVRSLGSSMLDFSRIPKLLYYVYQANWVPYATKPVVALAHHWNRSGVVTVNAFSNCPKVRLSLNGAQQGTDQVPNPMGTSTQQASDLHRAEHRPPRRGDLAERDLGRRDAAGRLRGRCRAARLRCLQSAGDRGRAGPHRAHRDAPGGAAGRDVVPGAGQRHRRCVHPGHGGGRSGELGADGDQPHHLRGDGPGDVPRRLRPARHHGAAADLPLPGRPRAERRRRDVQGGRPGAVHPRHGDRERQLHRPRLGHHDVHRLPGHPVRHPMNLRARSSFLPLLTVAVLAFSCSKSSGGGAPGSGGAGGAEASTATAAGGGGSGTGGEGGGDGGFLEWEAASAPTCGPPPNRFTVLTGADAGLVRDNVTELVWMSNSVGGEQSSQQTQSLAAAYCSGINMRLPTEDEALALSAAYAPCAFGQWGTWTSTDVGTTGDAWVVDYLGDASPQLADNFPSAVLCVRDPSG